MTRTCRLALSLIFLLSFIASTSTLAQDRQTVTQVTEWFAANSNITVNKRISVLVEGHFRAVQAIEPMQLQVRTGMDVSLSKHWSIMPLGYVYTWNPVYGKQPNSFVNNEHRLFQQVVFKHSARKAKMSHRLRLEQRFIEVHTNENNEVVNHGYSFYVNRIRYRFHTQIPLRVNEEGTPAISAIVYDELFLSFGDRVVYHEPDQNRIFAGAGYHFSKQTSLHAGPFYQLLIKAGGTKQENNVGVQVNFVHNFDVSR